MKIIALLFSLFCTAVFAAPSAGGPDVPEAKSYIDGRSEPACPAGWALTYTVQCDPGTRPSVDRVWLPQGAGVEICRVSQPACAPIVYLNANARPGHEVADSSAGQLVGVVFGLDRLLGIPPR